MTRKLSLFLALTLAFLATACLPDINITDLQTNGSIESRDDERIEVLFSSAPGVATVDLKSSYGWSVKLINDRADGWISWTPTSGKRGEASVEITVNQNDSYEERSATLLFKCGWKEQIIVVTQKQNDALLVSAAKVEVEKEGRSFDIELQHNVNFTVSVDPGASQWLTRTKTKGLETSIISFYAAPNDDIAKRHGVITFQSDDVVEHVDVYQAGADPTIVLGENEYTLSAAGGELKIDESSNVDVTYEIKANWIQEVKTKAMSTNTFYFEVQPNTTYDDRSAVITFKNTQYGISENVVIYQAQQDAIIPGSSEFNFDYNQQSFDVKVESNVDYSVSIGKDIDWIRTIDTKGLKTSTLSFAIDENKTKGTREAIITLSAGSLTQNLKVTQIATTDSYPTTPEEIRESEERAVRFVEDATEIIENINSRNDADQVADALLLLDDVVSAVPDERGEIVTVMHRDSTITLVFVKDYTQNEPAPAALGPVYQGGNGHALTAADNHQSDKPMPSYLFTKKALLLVPFYSQRLSNDNETGEQKDEGSMYVDFNWIQEQIGPYGYKLDYYLDSDASLDVFEGDIWAQYDFIMVITHGGRWIAHVPNDHYYTVYTTGQEIGSFTEEDHPEWYRHLNKALLRGGIGTYCVRSSWFEATTTSRRFPGSIMYVGACHSFEENDMYQSFSSLGVSAFMGWSDVAWYYLDPNGKGYANQPRDVLFSMIRSLCKGMSFKKAYEYINTEPDLWTSGFTALTKEHPLHLNAESQDNVFLVDPRPFLLEHDVAKSGLITLTWKEAATNGTYKYLLNIDDNWYDVEEKEVFTISSAALPAGEHTWYLRADLYDNGKYIDSYDSETDKFTSVEASILISTQEAHDITINSAAITGAYKITGWDPTIAERGIVYSRILREPSALDGDYRTTKVVADNTNPFHVTLSGLTPGTTYYARAFVIVDNGGNHLSGYYGNTVTFKTLEDAEPPVLVITPSSLNFGEVALGDSKSLTLTISNDGESELYIQSITGTDGFNTSFRSWSEEDKHIGTTPRTLRVTFSPTEEKHYSGQITFRTNDPQRQYVYITADGDGVKPIDTVVPPELREKIDPYIPIHDGINPPDVQGIYYISPYTAVYCEDPGGYSPGTVISPMTIRFLNQDFIHNKIDFQRYQGSSSSSGSGAFISGENEYFSAFFNANGISSGIWIKTAVVISGSISSEGIHDFYYAFIMVDKGDDPDGIVMEKGYFRVFYDSDGISERTNNWNPGSVSAPLKTGEGGGLKLIKEGYLDFSHPSVINSEK